MTRAERIEEAARALLAAMGDYWLWNGIEHEADGCPEDDTCDCPIVQRYVNADDALRAALALPVEDAPEQALRAALAAVEGAGADVRLTKASVLLVDALAWLDDYRKGVPVEEHYPRPAGPTPMNPRCSEIEGGGPEDCRRMVPDERDLWCPACLLAAKGVP